MDSTATREVRAHYTADSITVYQAYSPEIADAALRAGTFVSPFKRDRMTWIKPSFLWMAYRSGWATKPNQERVLAVEIKREGFEWALTHSCLSHWDPAVYVDRDEWETRKKEAPVRVQWDPERDLHLRPLGYRSIQIGLGGAAVPRYVDDWIISITDITDITLRISDLIAQGELTQAALELPKETIYPLPRIAAEPVGAQGK